MLLLYLFVFARGARACTTVIAAPGATLDGSTMVTGNNDCLDCDFRLAKAPATTDERFVVRASRRRTVARKGKGHAILARGRRRRGGRRGDEGGRRRRRVRVEHGCRRRRRRWRRRRGRGRRRRRRRKGRRRRRRRHRGGRGRRERRLVGWVRRWRGRLWTTVRGDPERFRGRGRGIARAGIGTWVRADRLSESGDAAATALRLTDPRHPVVDASELGALLLFPRGYDPEEPSPDAIAFAKPARTTSCARSSSWRACVRHPRRSACSTRHSGSA